MKQQDLRSVVLRSAIQVLTAALGSLAVGYLLRRVLAPKTTDSDVKSALKKLHDIEACPPPSSLARAPPQLSPEEPNLRARGRELAKELTLTEHECELIKDVVSPDEIDVDFSSIGSLEDIKKSLREVLLLPINRPELFEGRRSKLLQPPKGILLYGPPGTGKTMMAKAIAKEGKLAFININLATILNKWYGESEKIVRSIFTLAHKLQPCVVFFDEMDCFFQNGSSSAGSQHSYHMQVESVFMTLWDGIVTDSTSRVIVIGATNRPYNLSAAILRRMPLQFLFDLPNKAQRAQILGVVLANEPLAEDFSIDILAQITSGYSGSDLKELCKKAAVAPLRHFLEEEEKRQTATTVVVAEDDATAAGLRPMSMQDFIEAMKEVAPTGKKAKQYHNFAQKRERGGAKPDGDDDDDNADAGESSSMADLFQFLSAVVGSAAAASRGPSSSSSSPSSSHQRPGAGRDDYADTTARKSNKNERPRPKIEEIDVDDEGVAVLDEDDLATTSLDERIEKWSKRFEGENGARLLEQLCGLVDVDPSQPRPVVLKELAKHFLD